MAQHIVGRTGALSNSVPLATSLRPVLIVRLSFGLITLLGAVISFLALSWDVQWHTFVGRDRTLTPPHVLLLTGLGICGLAALASVLTETLWVKRNQAMAQRLTPFAQLFAAPLGAYIAGYAALDSSVAFPLDQYWHTLYGIDVTLWAPFHIMVISGLALIAFGATYTLASVVRLATSLRAPQERRIASIGMVVAMATSLSLFMVLVFDGADADHSISLGFTTFSLFPVLSGLLLGCLLSAIAYAVPWKWAATSVMGVVALLLVIDQLVVPPAITWLMQVEQLTFLAVHRSTPPQISVISVSWPLLSLISALLIDIFVQYARKHNWSIQRLSIAIGCAVFVGCFPVSIKNPVATLDLLTSMNLSGVLLTLALGFLGIFIGLKLGRNVGETLSTSER